MCRVNAVGYYFIQTSINRVPSCILTGWTANARDIHAALGVGKDFSNWVKDQIIRGMFEEDQDFVLVRPERRSKADWVKDQLNRGMFEEGQDFIVFMENHGNPEEDQDFVIVSHLNVKNPKGGRPRKDYHFTIDAGKHIAMMSGTKKGKETESSMSTSSTRPQWTWRKLRSLASRQQW